MAASALEEKINKIRQQNEEIRRRHEEVEEDKKKAAKLNALVQMVPSTDWPERKEPPEFSNPPRSTSKSKPAKEHHEHSHQYHLASGEGRKSHTFAQGQGPPPDPKYNFLADAEREEGIAENAKDNLSTKGQKYLKGTFKRKLPGGKDGAQRDYRTNRGSHRDEHQPEYEAWRAERNRIDEDRISRQRTAEGNWRREWDNDKAHIVDETARSEKLGDYVKKDHKDHDRRYPVNGNDYANHNRGGHRSYRGNAKRFHNTYDNRSNNTYRHDGPAKNSAGPEERTVVATDKSIKVTLNQGNATKGPLMSVKVNSPSIAGTGRVGPRQRSRVTYSSHSDVEITESEPSLRQKSHEEYKTKGIYHDNPQNSANPRKSQPPPRRKDFGSKSPYFHKKEIRREAPDSPQKRRETEPLQKNQSHAYNPAKPEENPETLVDSDEVTIVNDEKSNITSDKLDANDTGPESNKNDENDDADLPPNEGNKAQAEDPSQSSSSPEPKDETKTDDTDSRVNEKDHVINVCASKDVPRDLPASTGETERSEANEELEDKRDLLSTKDINDCGHEITSVGDSFRRADSTTETVTEDKDRDTPPEKEQTEIISNSCDSERNDDVKCDIKSSEKEANEAATSCSTDVPSVAKEKNKPEIVDELAKGEVIENDGTAADETTARDKRAAIERVDEVSARASTNEEKGSAANDDDVVVAAESPKEEARANEEAQ